MAQEGISPQHMQEARLPSPFVTVSAICVGAMLSLGAWVRDLPRHTRTAPQALLYPLFENRIFAEGQGISGFRPDNYSVHTRPIRPFAYICFYFHTAIVVFLPVTGYDTFNPNPPKDGLGDSP